MDNIIAILSLLGLGTLIGSIVTYFFEKAKEKRTSINELKMIRYKAITVYMFTILDEQNGMKHIRNIRSDLKTIDDVKKELEVELLNSILYAKDVVITSLGKFIITPTLKLYIDVVNSMRKDLWKRESEISIEFFKFLEK